MAKPILAALQRGKVSSDLRDDLGAHLAPLLLAEGAAARKEACRSHGPFLLQASQLVGQALGQKGLCSQAQADWLSIARHLLGGLLVIAPHAKCKHPLQLEKLAMGLVQKHLDARLSPSLHTEVRPHVDALAQRLAEMQGKPSTNERKRQHKVLQKFPAHAQHAAGRCTRCLDLAPQPDCDSSMCALALACLQARMACAIGQPGNTPDALLCCSCACLMWVDHTDTVDAQLARRFRGRLVQMLHEASSQQIRSGDRTAGPFQNYVAAIDVIMLAGTRPENVGLRTCVDHMVKVEELVFAPVVVDAVRAAVRKGYQEAITCITSADAAQTSWAVVECLRLVERYAVLNGDEDANSARAMWQTFIDWCSPQGVETVPHSAANALMHAAGVLHVSMSAFKQGGLDAAEHLQNAADLIRGTKDLCFQESRDRSCQASSTESDAPPLEYTAMLRMVIRGGVLLRAKEMALQFVQSPQNPCSSDTSPDILLAIEAVMVCIVELLSKAHQWEQKAKLPVKFGSVQLVRFRLGALHAASMARMEHGLLASMGKRKKPLKGSRKPFEDSKRRASIEAALSLLRTASSIVQTMEPANAELMRYVASFSYNAGIRLSSCERNEEAIQALTLSCEQLQACCGSNEDINQALCARWTLFAKCKDKMEDVCGIVESLQEVVIQIGASLSTDPSANRDFFAPLVFQHAAAYLKQIGSNRATEVKSKGKGKTKVKGNDRGAEEHERPPPALIEFLCKASKQISQGQLGIILEEYLVALGSAGSRLKMRTDDMQLTIIDKLLCVYDETDHSVPQLLGRARSLLHKARLSRTGGKLSDIEAATETIAGATELLESLREQVKDGSADHRHVLEHDAIIHTLHAILCIEQQVMRSSDEGLAATAEQSFTAAKTSFSKLILEHDGPFCDVEEMWSGLQMLSDYYRLVGDYAMELHFLRLRFRLVSTNALVTSQGASQCESSVHMCDRAKILAEASTLHTRLGFSEQGVAVATEGLSELSKLSAELHSERADAVVRFARAFGHCRSAVHSHCAQAVQDLLDKHSTQRGRAWSAVGAYGHYVLAEALWVEGDHLRAVQAATNALQVRASLAPGCQDLMADDDTTKVMKNVTAQSIHDGEEAHIMASSAADGSDDKGCNSKSIVASAACFSSTSTWGALHSLLESLLQTGSYACRSGRGVEGESYLHKALNIAERLAAHRWKAKIHCVIAELRYQRRDDQCTQEINSVNSMGTPYTLEHVSALLISADYCRKSGDMSGAISKCEEGLRSIEAMRHPRFLKERFYTVSVAGKNLSIVDEMTIFGQQPLQLVQDSEAAPKACLFPHQLEQAHARLELKQARIYSSSGDDQAATNLFKRALKRTQEGDPLHAIALYHIGCQHSLQCSAKHETVSHLWSLHSAVQSDGKSKQRKGRARKAQDETRASKNFSAARDCYEQALRIAITQDMAGLVTKLCHRLVEMHGRQADRSCCMLQASLCVPLCNHMQTLLRHHAEHRDIPVAQEASDWFSVNALVSTPSEQFQERYLNSLAPDWTVCSCTVDTTREGQVALFVSRMTSNNKPIVLRIPMGENKDGKLDLLHKVTEEWDHLIQRNIDSLQGGSKKKTKKLSTKEKAAWWDRRKDLDDDMKTCLQRLEQSWLGGFKGLLLGQSMSLDARDLTARAVELKETTFGTCAVDPILIELVLSSADTLDDEELQQACIDMLVGHVGSCREEQPESTRKLAEDATKHIRLAFEDLVDDSARQCCRRGPTIMLLGQEVQQLPWESLPCFRGSGQSVTRMPALPFVLARHTQPSGSDWLWHIDPGVQPDRTFYVLNPAGDLTATQETFEDAFSSRDQWEGFAGTAPTSDEYRQGLQTKDLFIYCGHSTGERYLRGSELSKLGRCAVTMLMGCSSGKLRMAGDFGVEGMPLSYVLAGCPALVANLWDVTDKDIDKFSNTLLESWVDGKDSTADASNAGNVRSLPEELPEARQACKFLYLNGAAPVCYGVPCVPVATT
jgi:hypothetical protein